MKNNPPYLFPANFEMQSRIVDELNTRAHDCLQKNLKEAEKAAVQSVRISAEIGYEKGEAYATRYLGAIAFMKDKKEEAFQCYNEALTIFSKLEDKSGMSQSYNDLGAINFKISDFTKAAKYFIKSLQLKEKLQDTKGQANTLLNLGSVYQKQNDRKGAMEMYHRSLELARKIKNENLQAHIHNNIGEIYLLNNRPSYALKHLLLSVSKRKRAGNTIGLSYTYNNIGVAYLDKREFSKAYSSFGKCIEISKREGLENESNSAILNIAEIHIRRGDFETALKFLSQLLQKSKKGKNIFLLSSVYKRLSHLFEKTGEFKKSLIHFRKYHQTQMKLLNQENLKQISQLSIQYEVAGKEKEKEIFRLKNVELKDTLNKLNIEKKRSDDLLKNILPNEVAEDLKNNGKSPARYFESASVMFIDIKDFTVYSGTLSPEELVKELDLCFMRLDEIVDKYGLEKIKTIGDAYLCAGGLPKKSKDHAIKVAGAAVEMIRFIEERKKEKALRNEAGYNIRIGIHTGPVIAGIIGTKKFAYDIWGDTVNTAARMEQSSDAGKINVSESTYQLIKRKFPCTYRGKLPAKNKGDIDMYFINGQ